MCAKTDLFVKGFNKYNKKLDGTRRVAVDGYSSACYVFDL